MIGCKFCREGYMTMQYQAEWAWLECHHCHARGPRDYTTEGAIDAHAHFDGFGDCEQCYELSANLTEYQNREEELESKLKKYKRHIRKLRTTQLPKRLAPVLQLVRN